MAQQETENSQLSTKFVTCVQNALLLPIDLIKKNGGQTLKVEIAGGPMEPVCMTVEMSDEGFEALRKNGLKITDKPTVQNPKITMQVQPAGMQ